MTNLIKLILIIITITSLLNCNNSSEDTTDNTESYPYSSTTYQSESSVLNVNINNSERISGIQFNVINNNNEAATILSISHSDSYNLYKNSCQFSENKVICLIDTEDLDNPISEDTINLDIQIESEEDVSITNIIASDKDGNTLTVD